MYLPEENKTPILYQVHLLRVVFGNWSFSWNDVLSALPEYWKCFVEKEREVKKQGSYWFLLTLDPNQEIKAQC